MNWWALVLAGLIAGIVIGGVGACAVMATRRAKEGARYRRREIQLGYQILKIENLTMRLELQLNSIGLSIKLGEKNPWDELRASLGMAMGNLDLTTEELIKMRGTVRNGLDGNTSSRIWLKHREVIKSL